MQADCSKGNRELEVLRYLSESKLPHPGKQCVIDLLDSFEHQGPNGTHLCLVLPVMLSDCNELTVRGLQRNAAYMKKFSRDLTHGVDFLHASGLIHTGTHDTFTSGNDLCAHILTSTRPAAREHPALRCWFLRL